MKLELQIQGYFTAQEFLDTLKKFEERAIALFNSELTDHEELIDLDSKGNFTGQISFNGQDFEEDKNDPILTKVIADVLSDILICEIDEIFSLPLSFLNDFCYYVKERYNERDGESSVAEIVLELMKEKHLIKKCQYTARMIVEGVVAELNGNKFYFIDEEAISEEESISDQKFKRLGNFKWEF